MQAMKAVLIAVLAMMCAAGCATSFSVTKGQAVMIARQVCEAREPWAKTAAYTATREGKMWSVLVQRAAAAEQGQAVAAPQEAVTVLIDRDGKVIDITRETP